MVCEHPHFFLLVNWMPFGWGWFSAGVVFIVIKCLRIKHLKMYDIEAVMASEHSLGQKSGKETTSIEKRSMFYSSRPLKQMASHSKQIKELFFFRALYNVAFWKADIHPKEFIIDDTKMQPLALLFTSWYLAVLFKSAKNMILLT